MRDWQPILGLPLWFWLFILPTLFAFFCLFYPTKAKRPKNSLLDTNKIEKALNIELPYWESEFNETIDKILEG